MWSIRTNRGLEEHRRINWVYICVIWICVGEEEDRDLDKLEEKVWDPNSSLTEKQIDQFLVVAR